MSASAAAKNLKRIAESVEQHDSNCEKKAKAVCLNPFELDRLGFDHVVLKNGRRVPIKADDSLGTGRLRIVCDGYHGPKKGIEQEETVEAPAPAERELVPAGAPSTGDDELTALLGEGFEPMEWQRAWINAVADPEADLRAFAENAFRECGRQKRMW
jgi:hypothetical protein